MIIGDYITRRAQLTPDKIALVDTLHEQQPITYRDWAVRSYADSRTLSWRAP